MAINYNEIGKNIRINRIRKDMKQHHLAEAVGVTDQHISHIECARTQVSLPVLVSICSALELDMNSVLGSNLPVGKQMATRSELAELFDAASPEVLDLCLELCKTVFQWKNN